MMRLRRKTGLSVLVACTMLSSQACVKQTPVTNADSPLNPETTNEMTEPLLLNRYMFRSYGTMLPGSTQVAWLQITGNKQWRLNPLNNSDELHKTCQAHYDCAGGIYVSVHNLPDGSGEIFYRIHKGDNLEIQCAWVEHYPQVFSSIDKVLQRNILGRSLAWAEQCLQKK
ncbi:hypothetical protein [Candidatus Venteria ishoeyi]|uniref:Lipoprotein n=1 Tax=Candidatus Venteria ishoeyi TaxID=1899563 RepID=A0A1H6FFQ0_9GAMM|nr:hypothetical protein [Candidatus Venteria ishoeyi]SEH08900.1 Uncharacterised protein [Candidatus Venteria ishoeyi]